MRRLRIKGSERFFQHVASIFRVVSCEGEKTSDFTFHEAGYSARELCVAVFIFNSGQVNHFDANVTKLNREESVPRAKNLQEPNVCVGIVLTCVDPHGQEWFCKESQGQTNATKHPSVANSREAKLFSRNI